MKRTLALVSIVAAFALSANATANIYVEGFEDTAGNTVFTETFFNHDFQDFAGDPADPSTWEILAGPNVSAPNALFISEAVDVVTFNTAPGEVVVDASVDVLTQAGDAFVVFNGLNENGKSTSQTFDLIAGATTWFTIEPTQSFSEITSIELEGFNSRFDNLQVETVPEPATMLALGAGVAMLAARRRKKNA
jgi:hypothetical protein